MPDDGRRSPPLYLQMRRVLMSEANRTNLDAEQFTVFFAPYRSRRVLISEATKLSVTAMNSAAGPKG